MAKATSTKATRAPKAAKAAKETTPTRARKAAPAKAKALTPAEQDRIVTCITDRTGAHVVFSSAAGATSSYAQVRETPELRKASAVGGSFKAAMALVKALPRKETHLAKGLDNRNAPMSVAAHRENNKAVRGAAAEAQAKAPKPAKADKAAAKAERKAARAAKAAPKADDSRKITVVDKKFTFGGEGTARRACWDAVKSGITVAEYVKAGGKAKYLPRWVSAGAIKLA